MTNLLRVIHALRRVCPDGFLHRALQDCEAAVAQHPTSSTAGQSKTPNHGGSRKIVEKAVEARLGAAARARAGASVARRYLFGAACQDESSSWTNGRIIPSNVCNTVTSDLWSPHFTMAWLSIRILWTLHPFRFNLMANRTNLSSGSVVSASSGKSAQRSSQRRAKRSVAKTAFKPARPREEIPEWIQDQHLRSWLLARRQEYTLAVSCPTSSRIGVADGDHTK